MANQMVVNKHRWKFSGMAIVKGDLSESRDFSVAIMHVVIYPTPCGRAPVYWTSRITPDRRVGKDTPPDIRPLILSFNVACPNLMSRARFSSKSGEVSYNDADPE